MCSYALMHSYHIQGAVDWIVCLAEKHSSLNWARNRSWGPVWQDRRSAVRSLEDVFVAERVDNVLRDGRNFGIISAEGLGTFEDVTSRINNGRASNSGMDVQNRHFHIRHGNCKWRRSTVGPLGHRAPPHKKVV
jgi:hypothetical protein